MTTLAANLGMLFVFKYLSFISQELRFYFPELNAPLVNIILPIGISFHTFQSIGYTTDVYLGRIKAHRHFISFATFISWFPQMVAGPIEKASHLLVQLNKISWPTSSQIKMGLFLITWGFFKKLVIADNLSLFVDLIYREPSLYSPYLIVLVILAYSIQIYCDFSGYTDIARGSSKLFAVELMQNFNSPYLSFSMPEFWKRWHISLSNWFFEYVYFPLFRLYPSKAGVTFSVIFVFFLSGIWHGANWTFVVWGLLNGIIFLGYSFIQTFYQIPRHGPLAPFFWLLNFMLISFCWIFFRSPNLTIAHEVLNQLMQFLINPLQMNTKSLNLDRLVLFNLIGGLIIIISKNFFLKYKLESTRLFYVFLALVIAVILTLGQFEGQGFIYFQF